MFISPIGAPEASSASLTACFSARVMAPAGCTSSAEPPPEMSASTKSSSPSPSTSASIRAVVASPRASGTGCAASTISMPRVGRP